MMKKISKKRGMGLVEIVIGSAIIVTGILAILSSYSTYVEYALANQKNVEAAYLMEEGLEAVTFLRDKGWTLYITPLISGTTYYLYWNGAYWTATTTAQYVDGQILRNFTLANVSRDGNDQIASSGTNDPNTKQVTVSVSYWQGHATTTKSISTYIANLYSN